MAVETPEDLAGMFHPDDFGVGMVAHMQAGSVPFNGIDTTGYVGETPGTTATISMMVPRIIAQKSAIPALAQGDQIELPGGKYVSVNDVHYKGELIIIHYHEVW
jgi:hypothetical protein